MDSDRDVFNEKPTKEDIVASATETKGAVARLYEQGGSSIEISDFALLETFQDYSFDI